MPVAARHTHTDVHRHQPGEAHKHAGREGIGMRGGALSHGKIKRTLMPRLSPAAPSLGKGETKDKPLKFKTAGGIKGS